MKTSLFAALSKLGALLLVVLATGCSTVRTPSPADPLEGFNRSVFGFNETLDEYAVKPLAKGYQAVTPPEVRTCVGNFFSNLGDLAVAVNNLLQGKPKAAASDLCRVAINTTVGIFGFADPATELGFQRNNEDFGQTLAVWGVSSGPYLVLPLFGPSTFRDSVGRVVDSPLSPLQHQDNVRQRNVLTGVELVNRRERLLSVTDLADKVALDKYAFMRDAYLARRESLIRDGALAPADAEFEPEDEYEDNPPQNKEGASVSDDKPQPLAASVVLPKLETSARVLDVLGLARHP